MQQPIKMPLLFGSSAEYHRALLTAVALIKAWKLAYNLALTIAVCVTALAGFIAIELPLGVNLAFLAILVNSAALIVCHIKINRLSK